MSRSPGLVVFAAVLAMGVGLWLGNQGGFIIESPGKLASNVWLVLASVPTLGAIWTAAAGWGFPVRRWLFGDSEMAGKWPLQVALGLGLLLFGQYIVGLIGLLDAVTTLSLLGFGWAMLALQLLLAAMRWRESRRALGDSSEQTTERLEIKLPAVPWSAVLMMPGLGLMLVAAASPPGTRWRVEAFGYDVISYHLQLPRQWLGQGQVTGLTHNVYSFLPDLIESAYAAIGAVHGSMLASIYDCQFFHVSLAMFTAILIATIIQRFVSPLAAWAAAALFLCVPWTIITASLAYTEMGMLCFAAAAMLVMTDWRSEHVGPAAVVGFFLGLSTLSKLTAGPMLAVPLGLVMAFGLSPALRWRKPPTPRRAVGMFAVAALGGLVTLSPYLIRNAVQSSNPLFPFAASVFGTGHWTKARTARWDQAHGLSSVEPQPLTQGPDSTASRHANAQRANTGPDIEASNRPSVGENLASGSGDKHANPSSWLSRHLGLDAWTDLARQWPYNTGYGAIGGKQVNTRLTDIAHFRYEGGFPILGVAVLLAAAAAVRRGATRRLAGALGLVLLLQVGFWLLATAHPSRYLIPTLLPVTLLIGLGLGRLSERGKALRVTSTLTCLVLPLVLVTVSLSVLLGQTKRIEVQGQVAPWAWVDSLDQPGKPGLIGRHPINDLPENSRTLVVADNTSLLYLRRPFTYASAFDAGPLTEILRQFPPGSIDSNHVTAALRKRGYTHLWIGWSELNRIEASFGLLGRVRPKLLHQLSQRWKPLYQGHTATLYRLPSQ